MADTGFTSEFLADVFDMFSAYVSLEELRAVIEESMYEAIRASFAGATREEVIAAATEHAAQLVTRMDDEMKRALAEKIATGLEGQLGPDGTGRLIRDGLGLDSNRERTLKKYYDGLVAEGRSVAEIEKLTEAYRVELINERAYTISRNEMGRAFEGGAFQIATERGATHKIWITVGDARVSTDICAPNQGQGLIRLDEAFGSGDMTPPGHVNCRCTCSYLTDTGHGELERTTAWVAELKANQDAAYAAAEAAQEGE